VLIDIPACRVVHRLVSRWRCRGADKLLF
jgi:hypothetical protein